MENQIKEYLQNHIQDMKIRMEAANHNTYDKGYAEGSLDLAVKLVEAIEQIHIPIRGVWVSYFENKLDEMYLLHDMEEDDFRKLLALANEGFRDYDLENFIEQAILKINPDKYGVYQPGAIVRVKHDLIVGDKYNGSEYTEDMNKIKDRIAIITGKNNTHDTFTLDIDNGDNEWTNDMVKLLQNPHVNLHTERVYKRGVL